MDPGEENTVLKDEKLIKYNETLRVYSTEIREWLLEIYADYGKQINKSLAIILKKDPYFFLYHKDSEFRSISYDCYSQLIKKNSFLKDKTELLFMLIKEYQRIQSEFKLNEDEIIICEEIDSWIKGTWKKYNVNLIKFAEEWLNYFYDNHKIWPKGHKRKSKYDFEEFEYDYTQKDNLFKLDKLYRKVPKNAYTRGRKQEFEILVMYIWLDCMVEDEEEYWEEYLEKAIQGI